MQSDRSSNYDFLRIICTIAVILIHVSSSYKNAYIDISELGKLYKNDLFITCVYNLIPRFAVPCFVMLSGAFTLAEDRNVDYVSFYVKKIRKIGIPVFLFSCGYFIYTLIGLCIDRGGNWKNLCTAGMRFFKGNPFYHMWYMYMMIGVYFLAPFVVLVKMNVSERNFTKISCMIIVWASISSWTSEYLLSWDLGRSFLYLGYFAMGYIVRKRTIYKKNNFLGIFLILSGILAELSVVYVQYASISSGIPEYNETYSLIVPQSPWIVWTSIIIFYGFSLLNMNHNFVKLSSYTFYIYLFHAGVWDVIRRVIKHTKYEFGSTLAIPFNVIVVFLISYLLSKCFMKCLVKMKRNIQKLKIVNQ